MKDRHGLPARDENVRHQMAFAERVFGASAYQPPDCEFGPSTPQRRHRTEILRRTFRRKTQTIVNP